MSKDSTDTKQRASTEHQFVDCAAKPEISDGSSFPATVRVLVVDDELFMRRFLERLLARWGYEVSTAQDGNTALALVRNTPFDLILLDVRMPEMSGVHVCEELRTFSDAVVIMLTALNRPNDVVEGFLAGADDYIAKPFRVPELEARIKANLHRAARISQRREEVSTNHWELLLNYETHEVMFADGVMQFSETEFALLSYLMKHADKPITKSELLQAIWSDPNPKSANLVEATIRRVRVKLEEDPTHPVRIVTCRSTGYMFVTPGKSATKASGDLP